MKTFEVSRSYTISDVYHVKARNKKEALKLLEKIDCGETTREENKRIIYTMPEHKKERTNIDDYVWEVKK